MAASGGDWVRWIEVQTFLQMAEQALRVRNQATEEMRAQLAEARSEKFQVEQTSSAAQEESSFLAEHMQSLLDERQHLKEELEKAQREKDYLLQENELLRQELLEGMQLGEEGSAAVQLLARQTEELKAEKQRCLQLENDNVQLQARVSALERANTAQATAMLSCLEESERVRLQQSAASALQQLSLCDSPVGPLSAHRRSVCTDDSAFVDAVDVQPQVGAAGSIVGCASSDCTSFVTCVTPYGSAGSGLGGGAGSVGGSSSPSVFHSLENSPDRPPSAQQQQQQQKAAAVTPASSGKSPAAPKFPRERYGSLSPAAAGRRRTAA